MPHKDVENYLSALTSGLKNEQLLAEHYDTLMKLVTYCKANNIRLITILFPAFILDEKHPINIHTEKIADFFREQNIPVIEVSRLVREIPTEDVTVNNTDPHAGKMVQKIIAKEILKQFTH